MKKILLLCFSVMVSLSIARAQNNIDFNGDIKTDVTWDSSIDTVNIIGNVSIDTIGSLTIESGVVIEFQGAYNIDVEGSIVATGTESAPVIFTVSDTSGYYNYSHEGWLGIDFVNTDENAVPSTFDYCEFYFGNANERDYWNYHGGVIFIEFFNKVEIKNSLFKYNNTSGNGGAIHVKDADILVENSIFEYNESGDAGGAINVSGEAGTCTANLFNNTFKNNTSLAGGGIRVRGGGNSSIRENSFQFNKAFDTSSECGGGGILITGDADSTIIKNNFFANNKASDGGAVKIAGYSSPILINNIIVNNTVSEYEGDSYTGNGGGIKIAYYANPLIINNTIVNNLADYGGGIFTSCNIDSVKIYNSIIYGNITSGDGSQVYINSTEDSKKIEFHHCDIEGDTTDMYIETGSTDSLVYLNNIDVNSEFVNATTGAGAAHTTSAEDWKLKNISPCIDTGDDTNISYWIPSEDFFGNDRITGDAIDIGAHEFILSTGIANAKIINKGSLKIYPNPASELVYIEVSPNKYNIVEIIDVTGKILIYRYLTNDKKQINISGLHNGLYFVKVSNQSESKVKRLIVK
ncbi:MAG TPA: T9SS type A sorting domain-containing protein [Bacteroidales bacterium]|nr:T9SS type A sorting domain-containing protein [Bacteroidales bacterium]